MDGGDLLRGQMIECDNCLGSGFVPDPRPCGRCGYSGCNDIECSICKGIGSIEQLSGENDDK